MRPNTSPMPYYSYSSVGVFCTLAGMKAFQSRCVMAQESSTGCATSRLSGTLTQNDMRAELCPGEGHDLSCGVLTFSHACRVMSYHDPTSLLLNTRVLKNVVQDEMQFSRAIIHILLKNPLNCKSTRRLHPSRSRITSFHRQNMTLELSTINISICRLSTYS